MVQEEAKSLAIVWPVSLLAVDVGVEGTDTWRHSIESVLSSGTSVPAMRQQLLLAIAAVAVAAADWRNSEVEMLCCAAPEVEKVGTRVAERVLGVF